MKVLVVGGGAREHALAWVLAREGVVSEVIAAPGNPGMEAIARCIPADVSNPRRVAGYRQQGGYRPYCRRSGASAQPRTGRSLPKSLEIGRSARLARRRLSSGARSSRKTSWRGIRCPRPGFSCATPPKRPLVALARGEFGYPLVIKADGLAAGKGVIIAEDRTSADAAIRTLMLERRFGAAGDRVVLEEFLDGQEASYFVLADGERCMPFASAQDHKRIFDGDRGPNTGGMGAFAPSPLLTASVERRVLDEIVRPVLDGMKREGHPYRGFLYVGLMLTTEGPKVIEFNVRFGDPEAQVVLPMLEESLCSLLHAAATGDLHERPARFRDAPHVGVVLAAGGYPDNPQSGQPIAGLEAASAVRGALVFHAGTRRRDNAIVTSGGRVLTIVGSGPSYRDAIDVAYRAAAEVSFEGMQLRRDIGSKALAV